METAYRGSAHSKISLDNYPQSIQRLVQYAIERLHPERVVLFGSRARNDATERSDYDIAIDVPGITEGEWVRFVLEAQEHIETLLSIDIVRMDTASETLKRRIEKEGILLHGQS